MSIWYSIKRVCVSAALAFVICGAAAAQARAIATFEATEMLGIDWARTLVTYDVQFKRGEVTRDAFHVRDDADNVKPCQLSSVARYDDGSIESAQVSFYAELPAGETYRYELLPGAEPVVENTPTVAEADGFLIIDNGITAFRMPGAGVHTPAQPLRFANYADEHAEMLSLYARQAEHGIIPGPLQGMQLNNGEWIGGSYFATGDADTTPKAVSYETRITEQGPLFVEAQTLYQFDNGGWYKFTARVLAGDPAVRIDEQLDMKQLGSRYQWCVLVSLNRGWEADGWKPDAIYWRTTLAGVSGCDTAFEEQLKAAGFPVQNYAAADFGTRKLKYQGEEDFGQLVVWHPWGRPLHYMVAVDSSGLPAPAEDDAALDEFQRELIAAEVAVQTPFIAVVPLNAGNWRGDTRPGIRFAAHESGDFNMRLPFIGERHPNTLIHTGEYDPELPLSFVRRQWALVAGPMQYHDKIQAFRTNEGYVNLDTYKDWILEWQEDENITYPRVVLDTETVETLAGSLEEHPAGDTLSEYLFFNDNTRRRDQLLNRMNNERGFWDSPLGAARYGIQQGMYNATWVAHYHWATRSHWWSDAEELLSSENLTVQQRRDLRAHIAAFCNLLSDPNFNPRGSMVHLGNPNMPINRFMGLPFAAALIPDHPRSQEWMQATAEFIPYKLAMNVAPNGAWSELITYYYASAPALLNGAILLDRQGTLDDATRRLAVQHTLFTLKLMTPTDPRFGARILPGFGHEGMLNSGMHMLSAADLTRESQPDLAATLSWAWTELGRPEGTSFDCGFDASTIIHADLAGKAKPESIERELGSTWLPGFGAIMRAHINAPDETYLGYRQGYMISHSDPNQGDFILYSKGAPLVTMSIFGYGRTRAPNDVLDNNFGWHSTPRRETRAGRMGFYNQTSQVHAYHFADCADYLRGFKQDDAQQWTRQIIFLKAQRPGGPDYFIFRDSFSQAEPIWWTLRTLGGKELVTPTDAGFRYESPFDAVLDVQFISHTAMPVESKDASRTAEISMASAVNWLRADSPIVSQRDPTRVHVEDTLTITSAGPVEDGTDIIVALYPLAPDENPPAAELLADGVLHVRTSEGTDYVFLSAEPLSFANADVSFEGKAGAVRLRNHTVSLLVSEAPGRVSYKGLTLEAEVPASRTFSTDELEPREIRINAEPHSIDFSIGFQTETEQIQPGVVRHAFDGGYAYEFDSGEPLEFQSGDVKFIGRKGGIIVNERESTAKFIVLDGEDMSFGSLRTSNAGGPYEVVFHEDHITGRTAGLGRMLYVTLPQGLDRLPTYVLDGVPYAPGTGGNTLVLPIIPGEHEFEVRALGQPKVFRCPRKW